MAARVKPQVPKLKLLLLAALAAAALSGCQSTRPLYHYGAYQDHLYAHFKNEDAAPALQIEALQKTIAQSAAKQLQVGPGLYAHLGYLYLETGQRDTGIAYLEKEKALYPESGRYIDFLLKNARASKS